MVVVGVLASATLAGVLFATAAQGGSGGVGSGGGGDGGGGGGGTASKYERIWHGFRHKDKRWAHKTAECESGGDPNAIGGGGAYRGAFQFMKSTWKTSPKVRRRRSASTTPTRPRRSWPSR